MDSSELQGTAGCMRKRKAISQAIYREKKKVKGAGEPSIPKTSKEIKENLDMKYQLTSTKEEFLRYCEYLYPATEEKLLMVFISDLGKDILSKSETIYCDGTLDTAPTPFKQIYFIMGQMKDKRPIICAYRLLPEKEYRTYNKMLEVVRNTVPFEEGKLERVMVDFKKSV